MAACVLNVYSNYSWNTGKAYRPDLSFIFFC
jgi:hypothetical protein